MIPTFNAAAFLGDALDSVLAQSVPPARILVVDDASTDDTVTVAERYAAEGHPVRCLRLPRNGGPATARNAAIREADEPLVAFLDADDMWRPDHCRLLGDLLAAHPEAVLAYGRVAATAVADGETALAQAGSAEPASGRAGDHLESLLFDSTIPQSAVMARRDNILRAGGYTEGMRYAEDYDLWLRLCLEGPFVEAGVVTTLRRSHEGQATRRYARMYRGAWDARRRFHETAAARGRAPDPARYAEICRAAYARDLRRAWQSRDRALVREVLALEAVVPGGAQVAREWRRRERLLWPFWRSAAWLWDRQPSALRAGLRRLRGAGAAS